MKHLFQALKAWLDNWLYRRQLLQLIASAEQASPSRPQRALTEELFTQLKPELFTAYAVHVGQSYSIEPMLPSIDRYTTRVKEFLDVVTKEHVIPAESVAFESGISMSVDHFLISHDGYYANQAKSVAEFRAAVLRLLDALKPADSEDAGIYEHNLRVLTRVFVNLRRIAVALLQVSTMK